MVLYACASCILGWTGVTSLTRSSLHARGYEDELGRWLRALIACLCVAGALGSWLLLDNVICCLSFSFACACMAALLVCDLREHVLPTELVVGLLMCAIVFRITASGVTGTLAIVLPAMLVAGTLLLVNELRVRHGTAEFIGSGDARMIVPLALFSGTAGIACGIFACALLMGVIALAQIACGNAGRGSHIALAPGLVAWLFAGTLLPLL